ncbi:MAG TPA: TlyA family RNA methyltransferase [Acidimicrobiales bacterium]|nr:TlyA family RNA methyltransferase [Acidimicrobiales bacterium]
MTSARRRLDAELVRRELAASREAAQRLIDDGRVTVSGAPASKASRMVAAHEPIELLGPSPRFVSRGGEKLAGALEVFGLDVGGRDAFDAGASTGGFTDCLIQAGATRVVAVDVGHGQLDDRVRADPRVEVHERVNVRTMQPGELGRFSIVVADLSFISLVSVLDGLLGAAQPGADLVLLVKPQFEAGKAEADRGRGVITDPEVWGAVVEKIERALIERGAVIMGWMVSPVRGSKGNVELFVHARAPRPRGEATGS